MYTKVLPALYVHVELHGAEQCERTLAMLRRREDVARGVRTLAVHPEGGAPLSDRARAWDAAGHVSRAVVQTARHLDALTHFDWAGEDMLPDDRMWAELRAR